MGLEDSLRLRSWRAPTARVTYDRGSDGVVIPGSYRNRHDAVDGSTVQLTIDDDIQFYVQQQVQQAKDLSGAKNVSAVVLDAKTGEVLAMANDNTFDPSQDIGSAGGPATGQPAGVLAVRAGFGEQDHHRVVGHRVRPVQPRRGAAGARLDRHGRRHRARRVGSRRDAVHDHRGVREVVQRRHPDAGAAGRPGALLRHGRSKFGLGQRTGVGLPGESAGPGAADRPVVGQHVRQPAHRPGSFDDAAADDRACTRPSPTTGCASRPASSSPRSRPTAPAPTSRGPTACGWCRRRPRRPCATCCGRSCSSDPMGYQQGTGPAAAVEGYQIAGKTGTAQQINPACGCYYDNVYWITFAGHGARRRSALRRRHHDGQPAAHAPTASRARRRRRCSTTSRPGCCSARTCRCRPTRVRR